MPDMILQRQNIIRGCITSTKIAQLIVSAASCLVLANLYISVHDSLAIVVGLEKITTEPLRGDLFWAPLYNITD